MASAPVAEELRQLRVQVDKLKERLDFMAPMLSLLTFTQDFFQRVECEASVQLMRLKNAKLALAPPNAGGGADCVDDEKMVDLAKWLNTMTDLVIALQGSSSTPSAGRAPPPTTASAATTPPGRDAHSMSEAATPTRSPVHTPRQEGGSYGPMSGGRPAPSVSWARPAGEQREQQRWTPDSEDMKKAQTMPSPREQ
eukprot:CAMPEP_0176226350 /NCGR_PEP_ID=MMETSP0121_2-20121125/22217_1 /TAXON_ID=160619 /ORGANISM="Kryptoperidinium foliaceum, Strain CCMP 1326" /LENGTH=195 /DNA_ID=CAMNT_0017565617 /DNA_START=76 /DNA_END=660 /DNA_ORIENTATION=+